MHLGGARDATFTLSGIIAWVGKQAQLNAKPRSLGEGRWLITHTIMEGNIKPRGPHHPHSIPPVLMPFSFHNQDLSPQSANLLVTAKWWEVPWLGSWQGQQEQGWLHKEAETEAKDNWSYGQLYPSHPCSHQTMDLRVIEAQCQLHHQCPQCLRGQEDPGTLTVADIPTGNQEAI